MQSTIGHARNWPDSGRHCHFSSDLEDHVSHDPKTVVPRSHK
jgi:hypothetical protein